MFNSVAFYDSDEEYDKLEKIAKVKIFRRNLRELSNPLDLPNRLFLKSFRVDKEGFLWILDKINLCDGKRSTQIQQVLQLATTLNILGGGAYQRQVGADWIAPMGQSTVNKIINHVIGEIEKTLCPQLIKFVLCDKIPSCNNNY